MSQLENILKENKTQFHCVIPYALQHGQAYIFNLSKDSSDFADIDPQDTNTLIERTQQLLNKHQAQLGIGRYAETRSLYAFEQYQARNIHLGIDLSAPANTPIYAPLAGHIHSFNNNNQPGNYGPTLILKHKLADVTFYTLYGHLSLESIQPLTITQPIASGQQIATIGHSTVNGGWPPHLHFQLIDNISSYHGDYPGVCSPQNAAYWLENSPNPNLILQIKRLNP